MIAAAARRFAILLFALGAGSVAIGALVALAADGSARRGAALGLYVVGAFCTVIGAALSLRNALSRGGPAGPAGGEPEPPAVDRELAGVLILLGLVLLLAGVAIDERARLV